MRLEISLCLSIFSRDPGGADVLQALGKLQLLHLSSDALVDLSRPGVPGPAEDQMIEAMDRVFLRLLFIGAGVMDHVGAATI